MDTTIRNLDEQTYRRARAQAALEGRTIGDVISEALRGYLARRPAKQGGTSLRALQPEKYPKGNEHLSDEIDAIVYGTGRVHRAGRVFGAGE